MDLGKVGRFLVVTTMGSPDRPRESWAQACAFHASRVLRELPDAQRQMLAFEAAKAAIQVFPLAFFGVIVAGLVRSRDERRIREEHDDEYRRQLLHDGIDAYNRTKRVRRSLRGAGFVPPSGRVLTSEMLRQFDADIAALPNKPRAREPGAGI